MTWLGGGVESLEGAPSCASVVSLLIYAVAVLACGSPSSPTESLRCENFYPDEFPPTDCAFLRGRAVDTEGQPLASLPVRVDSILPGWGYVYGSDIDVSNGSGDFELIVYRNDRLQQPTAPDTVTLGVKAYDTQTPGPADEPIGVAEIRLTFSPIGKPWVVTEGVLTFQGIGGL